MTELKDALRVGKALKVLGADFADLSAWLDTPLDPSLKWKLEGLCTPGEDEKFFSRMGIRDDEARAVCAKCPVITQCLNWALNNNEKFGVWGGMGRDDRAAIRRLLETSGQNAA